MEIRPYSPRDEKAVIDLWVKCDLTRSQNNPRSDIDRILKVYPGMFLVGVIGDAVIASVMGGYDGHRGWIYYLGVSPDYQRRGYGRRMMNAVMEKLEDIGCPKINIQIRANNEQALGFYKKMGYLTEDRISMAKKLIED